VLWSCVEPTDRLPIILRIFGGTSIGGANLAHEALTCSVEEIIRPNAAAVGISAFNRNDYEQETLLNVSPAVNKCGKYGTPVMAVTAVGKELEKRDFRYLAMCCRIMSELGADVVKHLSVKTLKR
jgi:3-hydroxy-5-phosphonooxypentane-2,4-dione thiolase